MTSLHTGVFGKTLVEDLRARGFPPATIAGNTGIDLRALEAEEEPKVPFDSLALLFERAAELCDDDLIGFRHAQGSDYRRLGLAAFTSLSSPTVGSLLHTLARYQRITSDVLQINTAALDSDGVVEWHFDVPRSVIRRQFIEFNATGMIRVLRQLTGRDLRPADLAFRHFRKTNLDSLTAYFGCRPRPGADENHVRFRRADLDLPLSSSDHLLHRMLMKFSEKALREIAEARPSFVNKVEEAIAANPALPQAEVARQLGMSARTLARRLAETGTNFARVVEGYRAAMARSMLRDSDLQITQIAFVLGYSDVTSFSIAFRRWTGMAPSVWRAGGGDG